MKSAVVKHSIIIAGHKTSVSLEEAFWDALKEIAYARHVTVSELVALIDSERQRYNLSSAIRLFVLGFYPDRPTADAARGRVGRAVRTKPALSA